jgi:hypothetical protein
MKYSTSKIGLKLKYWSNENYIEKMKVLKTEDTEKTEHKEKKGKIKYD